MKRKTCQTCKRPTPQTCICTALPSKPIQLSRSRVIVLQHPNERKRKNAFLPLIELCLQCNSSVDSTIRNDDGDFSIRTIVGRWLGEGIVDSKTVWKLLNDPNEPLFIFFPLENALALDDAIQRANMTLTRNNNMGNIQGQESPPMDSVKHTSPNASTSKINLLFIDATWKYAKEMNTKTVKNGGWPQHAVYVRIDPRKDYGEYFFKPLRFDIRTPPSPDHLSTAECIAHTLRVVEENDELFNVLMRPLDLMVQQWHTLKDVQNG